MTLGTIYLQHPTLLLWFLANVNSSNREDIARKQNILRIIGSITQQALKNYYKTCYAIKRRLKNIRLVDFMDTAYHFCRIHFLHHIKRSACRDRCLASLVGDMHSNCTRSSRQRRWRERRSNSTTTISQKNINEDLLMNINLVISCLFVIVWFQLHTHF